MTFIAEYHGECDNCGGEVKGQECEFVMDSYLIHVSCPPDPATLQSPVCPVHFTELPVSGVCGDCD